MRFLAYMTAMICISAIAAPAAGALTKARAPIDTIYDLYLGGIWAGEMTVDATFRSGRYEGRSVMRTAGIVGLIYKASYEARAEGKVGGTGLTPQRFVATGRMEGDVQKVDVTYRNAVPVAVHAEPAFIPKPWQIDPRAQVGTLDPISAALTALAPAPPDRICNQSVDVYDGRRRYAIDLGAPKQDGERIRCHAVYRRIAGYKPKIMKKSRQIPFNVWYERRPDGLAQVVRVAGESGYGLAVVLLRK